MPDDFYIEIKNLDRIVKAMNKLPNTIQTYFKRAGDESGKMLLRQTGLQKYPPATAANAPPHPYYIRGRGTQYVTRNLGNSEKLGTQFYVQSEGLNTRIGNRASYAQYVVGEKQAQAMGKIGWRRLFDVAKEKLNGIQKIYQAWVDKAIRDLKL